MTLGYTNIDCWSDNELLDLKYYRRDINLAVVEKAKKEGIL